jgi:hypothetical protein
MQQRRATNIKGWTIFKWRSLREMRPVIFSWQPVDVLLFLPEFICFVPSLFSNKIAPY